MIPGIQRVALSPISERPGFWDLAEVFSYEVAPGDVVRVPTGFVTDLASVPRCFWPILPPFGNYTEAAVVHDYLYKHERHRGKEACDRILGMCARDYGTPEWQAVLLYEAVRDFGQAAWDEDGK